MKSFGRYISKYFVSFSVLIIGLVLFNLLAFIWTFHRIVLNDYNGFSPQNMVADVNAASGPEGITDEMADTLRSLDIWAMFLDSTGRRLWSVELPADIPADYSVQDVAAFAKGYLRDYPVFIRCREDGLLVLGYPKESYFKITGNYYPMDVVKMIPVFFCVAPAIDLTAIFLAYCFSRKKIIRLTEPIISAIASLSEGKPVSLALSGDLSEVAESINRASRILNRQNQARANWISGVSHDIRTPLSMIMGYSGRIAGNAAANDSIRAQAETIKYQSMKIKDLVQDLNLVSRLEYDMQPVHKEPVRLSRLLRSYTAELLSTELSGNYPVELHISPSAETLTLNCDPRFISRAVGNLVQNSIRHNPEGCSIDLCLNCTADTICLSVSDNGIGLSAEKLKELKEKPHYMESTDDRLDLRHGLGLLLVRQITDAHKGTMQIESGEQKGCTVSLIFSRSE
ncbi:ATP-binding protein [Lachnospiraceae bacterium 54-11]